ncbi:hypothetical protein GGX14DRAFT_402952 [Mycena pura]|uniref:Uncharacterized protein n=1 Tax=Mycena pura TaxID=153505 RepID=A0AAD6Y542_9AGAR|nr:hypothetical protein GGX14DRAFT_402952 [Mycena pura]
MTCILSGGGCSWCLCWCRHVWVRVRRHRSTKRSGPHGHTWTHNCLFIDTLIKPERPNKHSLTTCWRRHLHRIGTLCHTAPQNQMPSVHLKNTKPEPSGNDRVSASSLDVDARRHRRCVAPLPDSVVLSICSEVVRGEAGQQSGSQSAPLHPHPLRMLTRVAIINVLPCSPAASASTEVTVLCGEEPELASTHPPPLTTLKATAAVGPDFLPEQTQGLTWNATWDAEQLLSVRLSHRTYLNLITKILYGDVVRSNCAMKDLVKNQTDVMPKLRRNKADVGIDPNARSTQGRSGPKA